MRYKVMYFTRTGTSEQLAKTIAEKIGSNTIKVYDNKNWVGIKGYIRAAIHSLFDKEVKIKTSREVKDYDELIVVSPLWAGKLVPAIKVFLKTVPKNKVHLVVVSKSTKFKHREGYQSVTDIVRKEKKDDKRIEELIQKLEK